MARIYTAEISQDQCIGDSLGPINGNYSNLDTAVQNLNNLITATATSSALSAFNITDSTSIDLTWTPSTRTLSADIKTNAVTTQTISNSAVTAEKISGCQTGTAPIFGIRAWVSFDSQKNDSGTANTTNGTNRFIRAQGNVSSVLMNAQGDYTITFATPMPDTNYCVIGTYSSTNDGTAGDQTGWVTFVDDQNTPKTVSTVRIGAFYSNSAYATVYPNEISVMIIR